MRRDFLTFLGFLGLAAIIWYGHSLRSVRNTHVPVFVQYTGKPNTIGIGGSGLPDTVMIEVRDAGARLNTYHRNPLSLTIDLHEYIHGEKGTIHVPSDALRRKISDLLQGTSSLIDTKPDEIRCPYFTEQEKSVVVAFVGELTPAPEFQFVGSPTLSRTSMKIYGQDKALAKIDTIYTERQNLTDLTDTTDVRVAMVLPKHIRADEDSIDLRIITERFTEKKFMVPIHVSGIPDGHHLRLFPSEIEVSVRVGMSHFAQVQATDINAICHYSPERIDKLDVELHYTNPYITSAWAYPDVVEYILEQ